MADNAVIGALRVVLGLDSASLDKGLDNSRAKLGSFASDIAKTGAVIAASIATAYAAVSLGVSNTLQSMDQIGKQSQKIGIPVEQLSALRLAADLSDVSMESLGKGMGKLSKAMVEAAGNPAAEAANAFRALGVSVKDSNGQLRPVIDVTQDIAIKFEGMKDGAGKTAASMAVFGKAGADLIPLLNAGGSGLQQMMLQAQALGITFDTNTAKAAEKFRDTLTLLGAAKDGIIVKLTAHMLPALQLFADRMFAAASNTDKQQQKLGFLTTAFDVLARGVLLVADNMKLILQVGAVFVGAQIGAAAIGMAVAFTKMAYAVYTTGIAMTLFNGIRSLSMKGILVMAGLVALAAGAFDGFADKIKSIGTAVQNMLPEGSGAGDFIKMLSGLGINIEALTKDLSNMGAAAPAATKGLQDFNYQTMAGKNAIDQYISSHQKSLESQNAEIKTFGQLAGAKEAMTLQLQAQSLAQANNTAITTTQQAALDLLKQKTSDYATTLAGLQLQQSNLTPTQLYAQELAKIQALFDAGKISAETYGRAMQKAAENANTTWAQAGGSIAGSFKDIAGAFSKESSGMLKAAQVFGAIQATISMFTGAAKALELPFPANLAAMAAVLAKGAALVASIKSQQVPTGMAMGGAFKVPGGIGGGDKVPFQAMLEPGELVEVSSNRSDGYQSSGRRGSRSGGGTYTLQVPDFLRPLAEALMPHIEQANKDGHTLKLVTA